MIVYITKHALSTGIIEAEAELGQFDEMITVWHDNRLLHFHGVGKEWTLSEEDAIRIAKEMRAKKIESLKRQISKLEKLKFD